mgnify:CR=1 FL=1
MLVVTICFSERRLPAASRLTATLVTFNITNVEAIALEGAGEVLTGLSAAQIEGVNGVGAGTGELRIDGDSADAVSLDAADGWELSGSAGGYEEYTATVGAGANTKVLIDDDVNVSIV